MGFWEIVLATALGTALFALLSECARRIGKRARAWVERRGLRPWLGILFSRRPWEARPVPVKYLGTGSYSISVWKEFSQQNPIALVPYRTARRLLKEVSQAFQRIGWKEWYMHYKNRRMAKRKRKA